MGKQANNQTQRLEIIASRSDMYREKNRETLGTKSWPGIQGKITNKKRE